MSGPDAVDFEKTLTELEAIVARLDREDISLDDAIALFRQGIERVEIANRWLDEASGRVEELIETAGGRAETRPFEPPDDEDG